MSDNTLTAKQERFCLEYVVDFNATQAAIRSGYSSKTAGKIGSENLQKPEIQAEIGRLTQKTAAKLEITRERVLQELARLCWCAASKTADI